MAKLTLKKSAKSIREERNKSLDHRALANEGESAIALLESAGFEVRRKSGGNHESACPFHEEPGPPPSSVKTNFYIDATTGKYICHSARCGERGNLRTMERHFGVGLDESDVPLYRSKETILQEHEAYLSQEHINYLKRKQGINENTISRFRIGWDQERNCYVIPYLEGRRPVLFRYYNPWAKGDELKYWWEKGSSVSLFNRTAALGIDVDTPVFIAEGEFKAMLLTQLGYAAIAVPGAATFKDEWFKDLNDATKVIVVFDNDNPEFHRHDACATCRRDGLTECQGHNPGQDAAAKLLDAFGWRGENVLLPLPDEDTRKTDVNEYFVRDGHSSSEFAVLALGKSELAPFAVKTLEQIFEAPPEEAEFLVGEGVLPVKGRLLVAGRPKTGKSILVESLALSLASGLPFLNNFEIDHPTRVLLLDREVSKRSLFERMNQLIAARPGYQVALPNLLIDHDHLLKLDRKGAYETMYNLVKQNGAEVVIMDTAYKFFSDTESSTNLSKAFELCDQLIAETGVSIVFTHHQRKGIAKTKSGGDEANPDDVAGSFLWTGWPNATILLNFLDKSVSNPFDVIASFVSFREAAPPEPLALFRGRDSIAYTDIKKYTWDEEEAVSPVSIPKRPTTPAVASLLMEMSPIMEENFLVKAAREFGVKQETIRPYFLDAMLSGNFKKDGSMVRFVHDAIEETWDQEHSLASKPAASTGEGATA